MKRIKNNISVNYWVTEHENDLNCIYIELKMKYYRMYIKTGDSIVNKMTIYENMKKGKKNLDNTKEKKIIASFEFARKNFEKTRYN